jgi:hypothetical protein
MVWAAKRAKRARLDLTKAKGVRMPLFTVQYTVTIPGSVVVEAETATDAADQVQRAKADELNQDPKSWEPVVVYAVECEDGAVLNLGLVDDKDLEEAPEPILERPRRYLRAV